MSNNVMSSQDLFIKKANSAVLKLCWIFTIFIVAPLMVQYLKGIRTLLFISINIIYLYFTMGLATFFHIKNIYTSLIKYIIVASMYCVFGIIFISGDVLMTFTFGLPIVLAFELYHDKKFVYLTTGIYIAITVSKVVLWVLEGKVDSVSTTNYMLMILGILSMALSLQIVVTFSVRFKNESEESIQKVEKSREMQDAMVQDIIRIAKVIDTNSERLQDIVGNMQISSETVSNAVAEIAGGASNNAESLQEQTKLTSEIQEQILEASKLSTDMEGASVVTAEAL